jgi:hypothetical protein
MLLDATEQAAGCGADRRSLAGVTGNGAADGAQGSPTGRTAHHASGHVSA